MCVKNLMMICWTTVHRMYLFHEFQFFLKKIMIPQNTEAFFNISEESQKNSTCRLIERPQRALAFEV